MTMAPLSLAPLPRHTPARLTPAIFCASCAPLLSPLETERQLIVVAERLEAGAPELLENPLARLGVSRRAGAAALHVGRGERA